VVQSKKERKKVVLSRRALDHDNTKGRSEKVSEFHSSFLVANVQWSNQTRRREKRS
jgi:hypothetical protein